MVVKPGFSLFWWW